MDGDRVKTTYCKWLDCDKAGHKIQGCHDISDFFTPTCEMCRRLFPRACAPQVWILMLIQLCFLFSIIFHTACCSFRCCLQKPYGENFNT